MPDDFDPRGPAAPQVTLAELPLLTPPRSAWPALEARLAAHPRPRARRPLWLAAAAALLLALALPRWLTTDAPPTPANPVAQRATAVPATDDALALQALMAESAQLEALVAWSHGGEVETGVSASLDDALQSRVEAIDALLARAELDREAQLPLWQERVLRLRQLAGLESTQQLLAASGQADRGVPVLAF